MDAEVRDKKDRFLAAFAETEHFAKACKLAGVARYMVYRWLDSDSDFKRQYQEKQEETADDVEDVLKQVAMDAGQTGSARVKAAEIYLKANRPEKYSPKYDTSRVIPNIVIVLGAPPKEQVEETKLIEVTAQNASSDD